MWFPLRIYNVRVGHLSQVCNPWLDFTFSMRLGEDGAVATRGSNTEEASKGIGKEGMRDMNGLPVTDEICHLSVIHFHNNVCNKHPTIIARI